MIFHFSTKNKMILSSIRTFWYKGLTEIDDKWQVRKKKRFSETSQARFEGWFFGKVCSWFVGYNIQQIQCKVIYLWYNIEYSIYKKSHIKNGYKISLLLESIISNFLSEYVVFLLEYMVGVMICGPVWEFASLLGGRLWACPFSFEWCCFAFAAQHHQQRAI